MDSINIGISSGVLEDKNNGNKRVTLNFNYIDAILNNGANPIVLPSNIQGDSDLSNIVSILDGLILSGGDDIDPSYYKEDVNPKIGEICHIRDAFEFKILELSFRKKIPILGICRGLQVINVYFGGSLFQDLSLIDMDILKNHKLENSSADHFVQISENSWIGSIFDKKSLVNSFHHQSIKKLAEGFVVTAIADDGVIEAIERVGDEFCCAVQWHPEKIFTTNMQMRNIFASFINICSKNKNSREP